MVGCVCECLYFSPFWMIGASLICRRTGLFLAPLPRTEVTRGESKGRAQPVMSSDPPLRPGEGRGSRLNQKIQSPRALALTCVCLTDGACTRGAPCKAREGGREGRGRKEGRRRSFSDRRGSYESLRRSGEISLPLPSPCKGNSPESRFQLVMRKLCVFPA